MSPVDVEKEHRLLRLPVFSQAWNQFELLENNFSAVSVSWYTPAEKQMTDDDAGYYRNH
ncbi:MAG: hypothetical protein IPF52_03150 [Saprospiraceae bacterium]|nr:hypothetical protein [Saprospiraceae bacterium]